MKTRKGTDALDRRPQLAAALATARINKCSVLVSIRNTGATTLAAISSALSERGIRTARAAPCGVAKLWRKGRQ